MARLKKKPSEPIVLSGESMDMLTLTARSESTNINLVTHVTPTRRIWRRKRKKQNVRVQDHNKKFKALSMLHDHAHNWYNNKLGDLFHNSSSNNSILHNTHNNYILTKVGSMCMRQALELEKILLSSSLPCLPSFSIVIFL